METSNIKEYAEKRREKVVEGKHQYLFSTYQSMCFYMVLQIQMRCQCMMLSIKIIVLYLLARRLCLVCIIIIHQNKFSSDKFFNIINNYLIYTWYCGTVQQRAIIAQYVRFTSKQHYKIQHQHLLRQNNITECISIQSGPYIIITTEEYQT